MTETNQKILYDNFVKLSKDGDTPKKRANCKQYAEDILKSGFAHFKVKENSKKEEPKKKVK